MFALGTQSGILCHRDALVINDDTGSCVLQLLGQRRHDGLLLRQNFCVGHFFDFTSGKIVGAFKKRKPSLYPRTQGRCKQSKSICHPRQDLRLAPPAVFGTHLVLYQGRDGLSSRRYQMFQPVFYSCLLAFILTPGPMVEAATQDLIYWPLAAAGLALMMAPSRAV